MWTHILIVPIALAIACGLWVVFQQYMAQRHPDIRGPEDSAHGCGGGHCGGGHGHCDQHAERHPEEAPPLRPLPEARVESPRRR